MKPGLIQTFGIEPSDDELDAMVELIRNNGGDQLLPRTIRYIEERRANQDRFTQGLVGFDGPMTALWGDLDPIAVVAMTDRLKELRPVTEIVRWADVGHWPSLEAPDRVAAEISSRL
jgi:pimeloyl-ACP methyl ester carboxylesterase